MVQQPAAVVFAFSNEVNDPQWRNGPKQPCKSSSSKNLKSLYSHLLHLLPNRRPFLLLITLFVLGMFSKSANHPRLFL